MKFIFILIIVPTFCLAQSSKKEISRLVKDLNTKLVSQNSSISENYTLDVNDTGILQIERSISAPKLATRKFTYSMYLKDVEYSLDSQSHEGKTLYAFVFVDKNLKKSIKQILSVKNQGKSQPEKVETESFVKLVIPLTMTIEEATIINTSGTLEKIFELAEIESSYLSSNGK